MDQQIPNKKDQHTSDGVPLESVQLMEDKNDTEPKSQHYKQIFAAFAVSLGPLAAGLGKGYTSPAIASLQSNTTNSSNFSVSDQQASWVASLSLLGALFGGMFGGLVLGYGRKRVLVCMSIPFSLAWILTAFATSVEIMYVTAFIGGFCVAIVAMVTQVYVSEIASSSRRGFLSAISKMSSHVGVLVSYFFGAYLEWWQLALVVSVAPFLLFVSVINIPETPSFLVLRGRDEEAYRSLQWLRGPNKNVEVELDTIRTNIRKTKTPVVNGMSAIPRVPLKSVPQFSFNAIYTKAKSVLHNMRLIKPILITCGLMVFQRFTGANAFGFYAVKVFRQIFVGMNPHAGAIAVAFVQLIASMVSGLLIDRVGRIPLLVVSSVLMTTALACFGTFVYYEQNGDVIGNHDWIPLVCMLVVTVAFSLGISPISWLLVGELFPLEYRGIGSSIATTFSYFCAFLGVKTFVDFQEWFGLHGTFWLYSVISLCGLLFVVVIVPETKGRALDEMEPKPPLDTVTINR